MGRVENKPAGGVGEEAGSSFEPLQALTTSKIDVPTASRLTRERSRMCTFFIGSIVAHRSR